MAALGPRAAAAAAAAAAANAAALTASPSSSTLDPHRVWLSNSHGHADAAAGKPEFMLRLPHGTTHVKLELKMITTDEHGQLHETNANFDGAPSAAWMQREEEAPGQQADAATAAVENRAEPPPKKQKRSHSRKKADKSTAAAPASAVRDKLRVRGDQLVSYVESSPAAAAAPLAGKKSAVSKKPGKAGRGKLMAIVSKEEHKGVKRWRCQWENGSESWELAKDLNKPEDTNTQRIFLNYEAKLSAALKKANRASRDHNNDEEKLSDESEEVGELRENEAYPDKILADRCQNGLIEYQVQWWCPEDARTGSPEISWEPAENLEGAQELLQDYFKEKHHQEKLKIDAGKKAARINSGQSDDEMSDDGLQQYEGQF